MKTAKKAISLKKAVSSQGTVSSQEETEHLERWSRIFDEADNRHETQLNASINQYEENRDSQKMARIKAENALLPVYRKKLRKVLVEYRSVVDECNGTRSHLPKSY